MKTNPLASRWHAVRKLKSNLALLVIGCLLVLLAVCWRLAIAPALRVVATDIEQTYFYDSAVTTYANPPGGPPAAARPVPEGARIDRALLCLVLESTPDTAVFQDDRQIVTHASEPLATSSRVYAVDRKTAEMVKDRKADTAASGYYLFFPFDTPKTSVPFWNELTGRTFPAKYRKSIVVYGLHAYAFSTKYHNQVTSEPPEGYPRSLSGTELKAMLSMPDLSVGDSEMVEPEYIAGGSLELQVEPRSGTIVRAKGRQSVSITVRSTSGGLLVDRPLFKIDFSQSASSVKELCEFAKEELSKIKLQFAYIPLGLLVLGILVFLIGAFAGVGKGSGV